MSGVRVHAFGRTDVGRKRTENQDRLFISGLDAEAPEALVAGDGATTTAGPVSLEVGPSGVALLVADGMGGRAGGARASGLAVEVIRRALEGVQPAGAGSDSPDAFADRLRGALREANRDIHKEARDSEVNAGMGTTATLAGLLGDSVHVAQVGDSRAYLVRAGRAERLTRDQSLVQEMIDSGILDERDALSVGNNMLLQALGVRSDVRPEITSCTLRRGDFLILCSDGLSQVVDDAEIGAMAGQATDCRSLCDALVERANERGGPDNVTVVAARLDGASLTPPAEHDRPVPSRR